MFLETVSTQFPYDLVPRIGVRDRRSSAEIKWGKGSNWPSDRIQFNPHSVKDG